MHHYRNLCPFDLKKYLSLVTYTLLSLLPPGLPSRTIAWTVSSELVVFCFYFSLFDRFCTVR